jgi:hypothetical protein
VAAVAGAAMLLAQLVGPRAYLYDQYPDYADRLDCVFEQESHWRPDVVNPSSGAAGVAQFIRSTWASTPQGRRGESRFDPYSSIDASVWLIDETPQSWRHWAVVLRGLC